MRRLLLALFVLVLTAPAQATWSILIVKRSTREVAVGCATCINFVNLTKDLPVVRPGLGVGNIQSSGDVGGTRKPLIWAGLEQGKHPEEILGDIRGLPGFRNLQLGIVSFDAPLSYSGLGASDAVCGLVGDDGDLMYAVQGNLMTGPAVCTAAEQAILNTDGDLTAKLMAGMLAAYAMGGDGRCSCPRPDPTSCGAPPPVFDKSAHSGFVIVSRLGDELGLCNGPEGCANGKYYLFRTVGGGAGDIDPILHLDAEVATWRNKQKNKPDHVHSTVELDRQQLVADGASTARVTVELRNVEDLPLGQGGAGALLTIVPRDPNHPTAVPGAVVDHGDGSYSFDLVATTVAGRGEWDVVVDFGSPKPRQLYPPLSIETVDLTDLHCGFYDYPGGSGLEVPFELNRGAAEAGRTYHLLGTLSGTHPGVDLGGVHVPLNRDAFFEATWFFPGAPDFPGSIGQLDGAGRAEARLVLDPAFSASIVGERFHFAAFLGGANPEVSSLVSFPVLP